MRETVYLDAALAVSIPGTSVTAELVPQLAARGPLKGQSTWSAHVTDGIDDYVLESKSMQGILFNLRREILSDHSYDIFKHEELEDVIGLLGLSADYPMKESNHVGSNL
jgi:hypothetical protein